MKNINEIIKLPKYLEKYFIEIPSDISYDEKIKYLSSLKNDALSFLIHIDQSRQRNLNITIIIFAGLFGISVNLKNIFAICLTYLVLTIIMAILRKHDFNNHKYSHGWRFTWLHMAHRINTVFENPKNPIQIELYREKAEQTIEIRSLIPIVYKCFFWGSVILLLISIVCLIFKFEFPFRKIN
jgi:hypothetical protein